MIKTILKESPEFLAGDHTVLRELLHPAKQDVALRYSVAHGRLAAGKRSKRHILSSSEVYYFLAGSGRLFVDSESCSVEAGSMVYVPPGGVQWLENTGTNDMEFLCLVDPAWKIEDETILE
ncbi:MAG: cupin domain-containing protein [Nitrospira sp.]|nr:cupin domain-containing protein [Nitrospira sp.]MCP9464115.1 cupin domain-containing protein [Nitrospira sp.]